MKSPNVSMIFRYLISGAIAATVHFGLLILLVEFLAINPTLASTIGFITAILVNYNLQYHWTFTSDNKGLHQVVFTRYFLVTLLTLSINTLLFWTMNEIMGYQYLFSQVFATGTVLIINFIVNSKYTFIHNRLNCNYDSH